ncbi:MAG TPA: hypothetical protein VN879_09695 [Candidatus Acidoferrales bacterium]|jgi:hypothetical protein|nr:hypothetical protein [Candidatus Acidoferrales bacterium]
MMRSFRYVGDRIIQILIEHFADSRLLGTVKFVATTSVVSLFLSPLSGAGHFDFGHSLCGLLV